MDSLSSLALFPGLLLLQSGPPSANPRDVGIDYDIVVCRMPNAGNQERNAFPDAANMSLYVGRGTQLVLIHPDGGEEVLFDPGPNGAVVDPCVSFDGRSIYFARFVDPEDFNTQRGLSWAPSHIWKLELATRRATQLTFGDAPAWQDTAHAIDPRYAAFDVAPLELPDGRILFLSSRDATFSAAPTSIAHFPAMKFWRMHADGSNLEPMENFSMGGCEHPTILMDGRIVWTHFHPSGRRSYGAGNYPLMVARQDLSDFKTFAGDHMPDSAWHFTTQLSGGDVVTTVYYHQNNYGHGSLVRFPVDPQHPSGQVFQPRSDDPNPHQYEQYGQNEHFSRVGEHLATPWTLGSHASINYDASSPLLPDGTRAGKCTMPAGIPGGHLLCVWSDGRVNALDRPQPELPHMKVCFLRDGRAPQRDELVILKQSPEHQYLYPRAVVPYRAIYGLEKPAYQPDTRNDGASTPALPAGGPFATTGTSSVYNRESAWPASYTDAWDQNIVNNYAQFTAVHVIGQDSYAFPDAEIFAAQVVVDMAHADTQYLSLDPGFRSHNNGRQIWGVLGEVPLRKLDGGGAPLRDLQGNPDTSYEVRIPADVPFHNRVLDRNGLMLTAEQTWHSARPGERKTNCGGCHAHSTNVRALDFAGTAAARPGYSIADFALQTPLLDRDAGGQLVFHPRPERVRIVEYHRDVKPIFDAKCVSCHGDVNPAGGLDLQGADAVDALAFDGSGLYGFHQATRWIRQHAATQSLLAWKVYGRRLDGRSNATRADDVDYTGTIMPPPDSGLPALTFAEQRTIGLWIDLGCLTDLTPGVATVGDPFDDQMKPTLAVSGIEGGDNPYPLPELRLGVYDLHSGVAPDSLVVTVTPAGGGASHNLARNLVIADGDVVTLALPALASNRRHRVDLALADRAGNLLRRTLTVRPVDPPDLSVSALQRGQPAWARVDGAAAGETVWFLYGLAGTGLGPCVPELGGLCLDLLSPVRILAAAPADGAGTASAGFTVPANAPLLAVSWQAVVVRGPGGVDALKTAALTVPIVP